MLEYQKLIEKTKGKPIHHSITEELKINNYGYKTKEVDYAINKQLFISKEDLSKKKKLRI